MNNIWGDKNDPPQRKRVTEAWAAYDKAEHDRSPTVQSLVTTQSRIEDTLVNKQLTERHIAEWEVWNQTSTHGTAMIIASVIPELVAQLYPTSKSASDRASRDNFHDTLWSFVDPFRSLTRISNSEILDYATRVIGWRDDTRLSIIEHGAGFESLSAENLEHIIDGYIDEKGKFTGRIKAFGEWLPEEISIEPAEPPPRRSDSRVGSFAFYAATMEFERKNTTHSDSEFSHLQELLEQFSGMMVFRDGFRVMPYGRPDSDYFQIEERRSKHAGREFWNHRRMLGRISISDIGNPNLKDKAGREGLIDNTGSKTFRALVSNVLMSSARRYFGYESDIRNAKLPSLNEAFKDKRRAESRERLLQQKRRSFRTNLQKKRPALDLLADELEQLRLAITAPNALTHERRVIDFQKSLSLLKQQRPELRLGPPPDRLAPKHKVAHDSYRKQLQFVDAAVHEVEDVLNVALETIEPESPRETTQLEIESQIRYIRRRISDWEKKICTLLDSEKTRISEHSNSRMTVLEQELALILNDVGTGSIPFRQGLARIEATSEAHNRDNEDQFEGILTILESLSENINLDLLATESSEEISTLRADLDRLNALAQLGITVEVIDHELASSSSTINHALKNFPAEVVNSRAYRQVKDAFEALETRLKFLSPLKLSGEPGSRLISGREIADYAKSFFKRDLDAKEFNLESSEAFDRFSVYEQPARIFPVFINLINNSRYWVHQNMPDDREILLTTRKGKIVVADNGPGIQAEDVSQLFSLFFTKRHGGRGVGLYLCRANLAAGGHRISYATEEDLKPLTGANFVIELRGAIIPD